jgi:hypothetical protein
MRSRHGQIGVCDKFAAERDEVAQAFAKPVRCALGVEATRHNQGSLIFVSDQANHVEGARLGLLSALHLLGALD